MRRKIGYLAFQAFAHVTVLAAGLSVVADAAFAFARPPHPAPAPLIGGGLALAGAVVATIMVVRRMRQKD